MWAYLADTNSFYDPRPTDRHDIMSYCGGTVFSDYNYRLMQIFLTPSDAVRAQAAQVKAVAQDVLLISGSINGCRVEINPEKIRDVIGKGGVVIRGLQEETGTTIEIEDDGTISIACVSAEGGEAARKRIQDITADVEVGRVYEGTVLKLLDFGAIVQLLPGKDGLLHISQISQQRVASVSDHLKEGQVVKVKVLEADEKGRVRLSMKAVQEQQSADAQ